MMRNTILPIIGSFALFCLLVGALWWWLEVYYPCVPMACGERNYACSFHLGTMG